ncbi:MAG: hypothetical protein WCJ71_10695, partial [Candidatus Omnitrophota bacterium]
DLLFEAGPSSQSLERCLRVFCPPRETGPNTCQFPRSGNWGRPCHHSRNEMKDKDGGAREFFLAGEKRAAKKDP